MKVSIAKGHIAKFCSKNAQLLYAGNLRPIRQATGEANNGRRNNPETSTSTRSGCRRVQKDGYRKIFKPSNLRYSDADNYRWSRQDPQILNPTLIGRAGERRRDARAYLRIGELV